MDGENSTLYADGFHARSLDSGFHPSRTWLAAKHAVIASDIPPGWRVCGENVYARHSVGYDGLPSYFQAFSVWNGDTCLGWTETLEWLDLIGLEPVPTLYSGPFERSAIHSVWSAIERPSEGYVVRVAGPFSFDHFTRSVAKFVRAGHVQSDIHWSKAPLVPNGLA